MSATHNPDPRLPDWDGTIAGARELQAHLAIQVNLRDAYAKPLRTVAGLHVDVGIEEGRKTVRAAAVLVDAESGEVLGQRCVREPTAMPFTSGLCSFRELPTLLRAFGQLPQRPDLALVEGHGIAHPSRLGIASHFGLVTGVPAVGVTAKPLVGESRMALHEMRGAFTPLRDGREQIGWLLRSKVGSAPLVVSPGHKVAMASAAELVMGFTTDKRWPEPLRLAQAWVDATA